MSTKLWFIAYFTVYLVVGVAIALFLVGSFEQKSQGRGGIFFQAEDGIRDKAT